MTTKVYTPQPSGSIPILWESKPEWGKPKSHGYGNHTIHGYLAVGKRRASHLRTNCAAISKKLGTLWHYPYAGTITVLDPLDVDQHKKLWSRLVAEMVRLGISAAWEREITKKNQINYHLVIRTAPEPLMRKRGRKLRAILRKVTTVKLNQQFKPIPTYLDARKWWNYCSKLVFSSTRIITDSDDVEVIANEKLTRDIYFRKRVLFRKMPTGQRLLRHGDFGHFWEQTPTQSDNIYKQKKLQLKQKRQANPDVEEAAKELSSLKGFNVDAVERHLHDELANEPSVEKREAIKMQNRQLAEQHHGGREDYADYQRTKQEQAVLDEQKRKLRLQQRRQKGPKQPRRPFTPAECESFTTQGI